MHPRERLQCPNTVGIFLFELIRQLAQHGVIVRGLVLTHALPVKRLGRRLRVRITLDHLRVPLFRAGPVLIHERNTGQTQFQMSAKFIPRQIAFEARSFFSVGVEDEHGGSPHCIETMEVDWALFDVCCERYEVLVDE